MAAVYVNGTPVDIGNEKLNLIQAAEKAGVYIPRYCWHPALTVVASCRMCLVEVGEKKPDGSVAMQPNVVPACQTPAKDGTVIVTNSAKAKAAQEQTLEELLLNHPLDCPVCDKAGECMLQDYSYSFGRSHEPDDRREEHAAQQAVHRREHHAVHRPLHHVLALRPLHARDLRHGRAADHQPRRIIPRSTSSPAIRSTTSWPATSSICARSAPCAARTSCTSSASGTSRRRRASAPTAAPAAASTSTTTRTSSTACGRATTRRRRAISCATRAASATTTSTPIERFDAAAGPPNGKHRIGRMAKGADRDLRSELAEAAGTSGTAVVGVLSPFLTCEEAYLLAKFFKGSVRRRCGWRWVRCRSSARTTPIPRTARASRCSR